jgi:hypothetical protein
MRLPGPKNPKNWQNLHRVAKDGLRWFVPLWPEIMRRIELGDRLIEVS